MDSIEGEHAALETIMVTLEPADKVGVPTSELPDRALIHSLW